jgi:outer membrane protein OmpA-like peptidoglycan-associated protein/tetratricopeptide (TPR) repeat protein
MDFVTSDTQVPGNTMITRFAFILLIFFLLQVDQCYTQGYNQQKISKKAKKNYELAMQQVDFGEYTKALKFLDQALETDANYLDALLSKAGILAELKRYAMAVDFYEKAFVVDDMASRDFFFVYAIALGGLGEFKKALYAVDRFLALPNLRASSLQAAKYRKKCFEFAVTLQELYPERQQMRVLHMGDSINSSVSEYYPSMTIDGKELIITRRTRNAADEDFYSSNQVDGIWRNAEPLKGKVNTLFKEGGQQITPDGKWMVFSAKDYPEGLGSFDIYLSVQSDNGWSERIHAGNAINTEYWESAPCLSPDKKQLYFSSDRPGGYGGTDLYVSTLMANGKWSTPQNLGPNVNTPGDESCPFMHADNQTLYFNSNGHLGYGGTDLYLTQKTNQGFSVPQNLGYPINTIDDEGSLFVTSDARTGFLASDRGDSKGGLDIYSIQLYEGIKPSACSWLAGRVYDSLTNSGLSGLIEVIDLATQQVISSVQAEDDGSYLAILPAGKNYALNVSKKGYVFYSGRFIMKGTNAQQRLTYDIPLQRLQEGTKIILKNIQFSSGSFELLPESYIEMDKLLTLLAENPKLKVQIIGHTDNVGSEQDNLKLSKQRAQVVLAYFTGKQISTERVIAKGMGAQEPIAENDSPNGRALNRRTEMLVLSNN